MNEYLILVTTALNKAEQVLGRKFVVHQEQQTGMTRERKQEELDATSTHQN